MPKPLINDEFIHEENYRAVWAQVCKTAVVDAQNGELDAVLWLLTDAQQYFEYLGLDYDMVFDEVRKWYIQAVITSRATVGKTFIEDMLGTEVKNSAFTMWRKKWTPPLKELIRIELDKER